MSHLKRNSALYKVVIAHYLAAAICFLILSILFFFSIEEFSMHYFQPKILAVTHVAVLGWGTLMIFGALYQLLPVILETELYSIRMCWISLILFIPGMALLVCSFWVFDTGVCMQVGGVSLLTSIIIFSFNVYITIQRKNQSSVYQEFILTACIWLTLTALFGLLLVFNFHYAFLSKSHLQYLRLHAHMGIVGWFLILIIGISGKLIPMFLVSKYQSNKLLWYSYYLINGSLLWFLVDGYQHGIHTTTYVIFCFGLAGVVTYLTYVYKCFSSRLRSKIELPMVKTFLSVAFLALAVAVVPVIIYYHEKNNEIAVELSKIYGFLLIIGWISTLILGQTFKTLPFIVWVKHYEHLTGKVKTPLPADMINQTLLYTQYISFGIFLPAFFTGLLLSSWLFKFIGICCLLITALSYLMNIIFLLSHKTKTEHYARI